MRFAGQLLVFTIRIYQNTLARILPPCCRYYPTCSAYAIDAIGKHGAAHGLMLAARRLLRCHPFGSHGYDPVP